MRNQTKRKLHIYALASLKAHYLVTNDALGLMNLFKPVVNARNRKLCRVTRKLVRAQGLQDYSGPRIPTITRNVTPYPTLKSYRQP